MDTTFDDLSMDARNAQNKAAEHDLWKKTLALSEWFFVSSGGDDPAPVVGMIDGKPHLLAFTDEERAGFVADRLAMSKGDVEGATLCMDVPDAVEYAAQLRDHGIAGIHFNDGEYAFNCGFDRLADMASRYR